MNSLLLSDVNYDSQEDWGGFQLLHGMMHQKAYDTILQLETLPNVPFYLDLFTFPQENDADYLLDHWRVHASNATLLSLPGIPDLSSVDMSDASQRQDWLAQHALVHANENIVLGIT